MSIEHGDAPRTQLLPYTYTHTYGPCERRIGRTGLLSCSYIRTHWREDHTIRGQHITDERAGRNTTNERLEDIDRTGPLACIDQLGTAHALARVYVLNSETHDTLRTNCFGCRVTQTLLLYRGPCTLTSNTPNCIHKTNTYMEYS